MSSPARHDIDAPRQTVRSSRPALALASAPLAELPRTSRAPSIPAVVVRGIVRIAEFALIAVLGLLIAVGYVNESSVATNALYLACIVLTGFACVAAFELLGLNTLPAFANFVSNAPRVALGATLAFMGLLVALTLSKSAPEVSRVWLAAWFLGAQGALIASRMLLAVIMRSIARSGRLYQRVAIFGTGEVTGDVLSKLGAEGDPTIRIAGIFDDRDEARAPLTIAGYPRLGGIDDLVTMCRSARFDTIIVALPLAAEVRLNEVVSRLSVLPVDIKMPAAASRLRFSPRTYSYIGSVAMIDLCDRPLGGWSTVLKWIFDKVVAAIALVVLAPVMAGVALAVKLDSRGPVFFRQKRYGFNNQLIEVFKFRSMHTDRCDAAASKLVTKDDPRVTRVGRIIRKTSLDELPQLFNVLLGDLSLVGPRPHALQAKAGQTLYDEAVEGYFARHKVKPGITGWAQINGWRGETDTLEKIEKRVLHDIFYIENWSLFLDLYILAKTPVSLLKSENAY